MDNQNPYGGGGSAPGGYPSGGGYPGGGGGGGYPGGGGGGGYPGGGAPMGMTGTLDVGDVLSTTFRTIGSAFVPIAGCAIAVVLPQALIMFVVTVLVYFGMDAIRSASPDEMLAGVLVVIPIYIVTFVVTIAAQAVGQGGIMYAVVEQLSGRSPQLGAAFRVALSRAFWVFLTQFIVGLAALVGFAACFVPGVIVTIFFCVSSAACIVEKLGPIDSISRSIQLTEGQRLTIFLIFLVVGIGYFICAMCILMPVQMVVIGGAAAAGGPGAIQDPLSVGQILNQIIQLPVTMFATMLFSTLVAVIYARLRGLRDGVDAQALASVFS
jgi:hypothetical protein